MLNKVILIGRITKDPELRSTNSGKSVSSFTLAVNRMGNDQPTDFINCVVWEKQAENLCKYVNKGNILSVDGQLQVRSYELDNGEKRQAVEVLANRIVFLENSNKNTSNDEHDNFFKPSGKLNVNEEDLPF